VYEGDKMNYPARIFRDLTSTWHQDAANERVDRLAAELAAQMADKKGSLCLGLVQKEAIATFHGLVFLLDSFGLMLRQRYREQGDGVFVFLDRKEGVESEFAGAVVHERFAAMELPRAA